jgi:endogenous inhibitor of DNA gyrase (YacG/DUF329 family)
MNLRRPAEEPNIVLYGQTRCPYCGTTVNATSQLDTKYVPDPKTGDYVFCIRCTQVGVYQVVAGSVTIRQATAQETAEAERDNADTFAKLRSFQAQGGHRWLM